MVSYCLPVWIVCKRLESSFCSDGVDLCDSRSTSDIGGSCHVLGGLGSVCRNCDGLDVASSAGTALERRLYCGCRP